MRIVKIGLYCIIGIVCALLLLEFFIPSNPDKQTWPEQLLLQRQALLEQQEEDHWRDRVAQAGQNQELLTKTAQDAITAGNYLGAYKAISLLQPGAGRNNALESLLSSACGDCASLGWAVAALQELQGKNIRQLESALLKKWEECQAGQK